MDYTSYRLMNSKRSFALSLSLVFCAFFAAAAHAQSSPPSDASATPKAQSNRVRIEVVGGDAETPVENASVYLKYTEARKLRKDKKIELNVKTNHDGVAHVPDAPLGKALIQVIAEGWKTYGKWVEITDPRQTIRVKLEKPPRWY
ncbi:MAG: hypothetical protein JSS69_09990 [Acidobacteria bacterium]|nr:hypothetical protein [Acidobacteriota bacterium]MBS1866233.1 hypothetical protein [Acidobacteriota bacterium]